MRSFKRNYEGSLFKGKPKEEKKKENTLVPASNTVTKITALSLVPVAQIKLRAKESSLSESLKTDTEPLNGKANQGHAPSGNIAVKQSSREIEFSLASQEKRKTQ